ncbi:hypothetical protein T440DRAFT_384080 [Plenodomus tracheiphilus IPT5]|uniref:Uncharacterized protein n=1 Tax=Plenodomus tracheiphilus IPT5 TaxID=1408161 RepID=A0A6A7BLS5_9PLEO|nr:hypothetical protein T440DRAFT_384080 [Plenodomus tracheiphilus IPT5]
MKILKILFAFTSLIIVALGTAAVQGNNAVTETPCEWCSNVYKACQDRCPRINGCDDDCHQEACFTYINGKTCTETCLWHCTT